MYCQTIIKAMALMGGKGQELQDVSNFSNGMVSVYYRTYTFSSLHDLRRVGEMHGARRVIIFCLLTAVLPTILLIIPLYLRHNLFADVVYPVAESDILEIGGGISTVFCQDHTLKMNTSFNAYQLDSRPEISSIRKQIRLKKSMRLPDDTLEYWGFFLLKGSTVKLSVCSKYEGARILVVKGDKILNTCGLLDHKGKNEPVGKVAEDQGQVFVTYETNAQEILPPHTQQTDSSTDNNATRKGRSIGENVDFNDAREDTEGMKKFFYLKELAKNYISKKTKSTNLRTFEESVIGRKLRHSKSHEHISNEKIEERIEKSRERRNVVTRTAVNLDAKVAHGGNSRNFSTRNSDEDSRSSFETSLLTCYDGNILLNHGVPYSDQCTNISFLQLTKRITTTHNVISDGYYYYIFYSDNDDQHNDIHAVFDIYKPTYQYANVSKNCVNQTECTFPVSFLSDEFVIVEVPTRDGIEHESDDITFLVSTCEPRMSVYIIFPILVLFLILGCAFL